MQGTIRALFIKEGKGRKSIPVDSAKVVKGGLEGDRHAGSARKRQILLLSGAVLDDLQVAPGTIYENIVIDGLDVMVLQAGQELRIGDALVAVTIPCDPCVQMERIRPGLQRALEN